MITMLELKTWNNTAMQVLTSKMQSLPLTEPTAPRLAMEDIWLVERRTRSTPPETPHTLFVLQDWGVYSSGMTQNSEVAEIRAAITNHATGGTIKDQSLRNLFSHIDMTAFANGSVAIINAIWGVRREGSKASGYLGDTIHKAAFPIWHDVLKALARGQMKHVFFCGEWAKGNGMNWGDSPSLDNYLRQHWRNWSGVSLPKPHLFGAVNAQIIKHPASWSSNLRELRILKQQGAGLGCWRLP